MPCPGTNTPPFTFKYVLKQCAYVIASGFIYVKFQNGFKKAVLSFYFISVGYK
jgi:hypothetical protein